MVVCMVGVLLLYLGLAAAIAVTWRVAPLAALAIFIIAAVIHFAEDWPELQSSFLAQGMALALLTAPTILHLAELKSLFEALSGQGQATIIADLMLLIAPMSVAVAGVSIWTLWRSDFKQQAVSGAMMIVGMILLPPLIGFALFFALYHSPRHLGMARARMAWTPSAPWIAALLTLAALGITAALFAGELRADLSARVVAASFMTLAVLTVPHMIVPALVGALTKRQSSARRNYGRTSGPSAAAPIIRSRNLDGE